MQPFGYAQDPLSRWQKPLSLGGQPDGAALPLEQLGTQRLFKPGNSRGYRRLRGVEAFRRLSKASESRHQEKGFELLDVERDHESVPDNNLSTDSYPVI